MSITYTYTSDVSSTLNVVPKYEELVKQSLDGESAYIRAKETLEELFKESSLSDAQRSDALVAVVSNVVNSITTASMSTALEWAKAESDIALKKIQLEKELEVTRCQAELVCAQKDQIELNMRLAQIESRRMYGVGTFDGTTGALLSLTEEGKVWTDMLMVEEKTLNTTEEREVIKIKVKESEAAIHKIVADTYVNFGTYTFTYDADGRGIETITPTFSPASHTTLSVTQQEIAIEQAKGYAYNAWANALTGSASMLGTAIAADYAEFGPGQPGGILLDTVLDAAANLKAASTTTNEAIPSN